MRLTWRKAPCERPDPYLDWEFRTRREPNPDPWCSVQIQIGPLDDALASLLKLQSAVQEGRVPGDDAPSGIRTIRMSDDERKLLQGWIGALGGATPPEIDKIDMQFFIYRQESFLYLHGEFNDPAFYQSLFAGPPIVGLQFNDFNEVPKPTTFPHNLITAQAVAIGIIDDGIAFAHERFRGPDMSSRVGAIWLQETEKRDPTDDSVVFGRLITKSAIDADLRICKSEDQIYRKVGVTNFGIKGKYAYNPLAERTTHGTHLLDLAAGGLVERPILAVQLPSVATIDTSGLTMGSYVLQAVRMIMIWADHLKEDKPPVPLVINFSYGLLAGPKDGSQYLEKALADLVHHRNKRHQNPNLTRLVMPAGNSYRTRAAAKLELGKEVQHLDWVIRPDDGATNYVEIWLDTGAEGKRGGAPVEVCLTAQDEKTSHPIRPSVGHLHQATIGSGPIAGVFFQRIQHGKTVRERILLAVNPTVRNDDSRELAPSGRWKLSIKNLTKNKITAHVYVQRDDTPFGYPRRGRQSYIDHAGAYESDPKTGDYRLQAEGCPIIYAETLSSIATCSMTNSDHVIVVGAAQASEDFPPSDHAPPADYTSSGPTKGRRGPDCAAFADEGDALWGMLAAGTFSGSVVKLSGTSVAAPQIVRQVASQLPAMAYPASAKSAASDTASSDSTDTDVTVRVDPPDPRLGKYIFRPASDGHIPKRRYPAVKEP
ncbi:hypothetical protein H8A95_13975 [Bradyrhizobium sp. Pear76]|uniref:hypothetical protein n=1 Tax=Bradyrhizobium oropedii TaxID=1571201 RepID=UPI001E32E775|nr:hypothetical protein [Bradyrhizobium oropedii]MCC8963383.1 hypothetical protein [Bradyrhizobium oropedii]